MFFSGNVIIYIKIGIENGIENGIETKNYTHLKFTFYLLKLLYSSTISKTISHPTMNL
jgi:hypothetical protein